MLAGIFYGAQYGGSTTAILVNLPGETSSIVTCIDGHQMARKGRAGPALAAAGLASFFAGCFGTLVLAAFSAPLIQFALKFGAAEYVSLMILGLIGAIVLASGSMLKAIGMILLGLMLGSVGTDVNTGIPRFNLGIPELSDGIGFIIVAMGIYGYAEIVHNLSGAPSDRNLLTTRVSGLFPDPAGLPAHASGCGPRHRAGLDSRYPARRRSDAGRLRRLHDRAEDAAAAGRGALRPGQHPRRRRAGGRQQCGGPDLFHPAADPRPAVKRRHGADGRRHDDPQYPAGPAGDDGESVAVLGPDRLDVDRQRHAGDPQPATDRHVDPSAVYSLRWLFPAIVLLCAIGVYSTNNNTFDIWLVAVFGLLRLHLHQAEARTRPAC